LTYLEALLLSARNRFEDARPLFEAAITRAIGSEGVASRTAFEVRLYLAQQLMFRERVSEGVEFGNQAIAALQGLGGVDGIRAAKAQAEIATLRFYMRHDRYQETIDELERISAQLSSKNAVPVEVLADIDFYRAIVLVAWGDFALAKPLLESSSPIILRSTQSLLRQFRVAAVNSECAIFMGDHKAAERFLQQRADARMQMGTPDSPPSVYDWSLTALNLHMQGRHQEAHSVLLQTPSFASRWQGDPVSDYAAVIPLTFARVHVDTGNVKAAHDALPAVFPPLEKDETLYDSYYQIRGEIRCAAGDHAGGLADLSAAMSMQGSRYSPSHPWIARMRAVAGLCAVQAGQHDRAAELADLSRKAFSAQPNVSSYFKAPLTRLDSQLRVKSRT
jgi:tetratricopeptide (TPR) repeat protein